jgi:predicted acetyltransferase/8-oxo-dGTP pyrophosphatase MutT (NUDIX family)
VVERGGRFLVLERRADGREYAEFPAGTVRPDESPADAAVRVLADECGLTGTVERQLFETEYDGRPSAYFHVVGTEGPATDGSWVRSADLVRVGLEPREDRYRVVSALWPIEVRRLGDADWPVVERLWQLHRHDLSDTVESTPDAEGLYKTVRLTEYRDEPQHWGYLLLRAGLPIGFLLVRRMGSGTHVLGEFFIVRAVRRTGVGRAVVADVLATQPGDWTVAFQAGNTAAARFWRQIAAEYFEPGWTEELGPVQGKPEIPSDVWLHGTTRGTAPGATA